MPDAKVGCACAAEGPAHGGKADGSSMRLCPAERVEDVTAPCWRRVRRQCLRRASVDRAACRCCAQWRRRIVIVRRLGLVARKGAALQRLEIRRRGARGTLRWSQGRHIQVVLIGRGRSPPASPSIALKLSTQHRPVASHYQEPMHARARLGAAAAIASAAAEPVLKATAGTGSPGAGELLCEHAYYLWPWPAAAAAADARPALQ